MEDEEDNEDNEDNGDKEDALEASDEQGWFMVFVESVASSWIHLIQRHP